MGLVLAGAYLGGGLASAAHREAATAQTIQMDAPAAAAPSAPLAINRPTKINLTGPAARPFRAAANTSDLDCLTEAVYYEARGEGAAGQAAVAQVILNRVRHPAFPRTVCGVVFQGCQFSFTCNGAMSAHRNPVAWNRARNIAERALAGAVMASVGNATHFHTINVTPNWGPSLLRVGQVGMHVFYRLGGRAGRPGAFSVQPSPSGDGSQLGDDIQYARYEGPSPLVSQAYLMNATTAPKVEIVDGPLVAKPADVAAATSSAPVTATPARTVPAQAAAKAATPPAPIEVKTRPAAPSVATASGSTPA